MSSKTRKLIWSVPLMATLAVVGALAVFVALGLPNANPAHAQADVPPAQAPQSVMTAPGPNRLKVTWVPPNNATLYDITGYKVDWRETDAVGTAYADADTATVSGVTTLEHIITGLDNTISYTVRVSAVNAVGVGVASMEKAGMPATVVPDAPTGVMATSIGARDVTITWVAPDFNGGASVTAYRVTSNGDDPTDGSTPVTGTSHTFMELNPAVTYVLKVAAFNSEGTGSPGMLSVTTKQASSVVAADGTDADPNPKVSGFSTSPGGQADIRFEVDLAASAGDTDDFPVGSSVVIFLEDDFQVPDTISTSDVFFTSDDTASGGAPVQASRVIVDSDDYTMTGTDSHTIRVYLPDMNPAADVSEGIDGGETFVLRITKEAGIRSDTEAKDTDGYKVAYELLNPGESIVDDFAVALSTVDVRAKVSLSDENNKRGYELNIIGKGLNSGRTATAYVLKDHDGSMPTSCDNLIDLGGESVGSAVVGSDHAAVVVDTVTTDNYSAGKTNYICMEDDNSPNSRMTTVKQFEMQASIAASPAEVSSGDEVTVAIRDFSAFSNAGDVTKVSLAGDKTWMSSNDDDDNDFDVEVSHDDKELTFDMPGGVSGSVEISITVANTKKQTTITVNPSGLMLSKSEVAPNESIVISGTGFSESSKIFASMILIDGKALDVDEAGTEGTGVDEHVVTTSSGQFTATVNIWHDGAGNPALDADTYTIKITDENGYEGETTITILEPTLMVTPEIAGPRDYILITGANWPVTTSDDDNEVSIELDDKSRSARIDSTGRFNYEYQLSGGIDIGAEHDIVVSFTTRPDIGDIEEIITFSVPSSNVVIIPPAAAPGQTIQLELSGMPIYERVNEVVIDGGNRLGGTAVNTDSEGSVTITGIVIPFADPGFYPVKIVVGTGGSAETAIVQLEILAEDTVRGTASPLPEAVMDLGDSVVRIFHFNTRSKVWTFYDPREEFEGLNTLTELAAGQPYSILVSENVENVVLNGRTRDLTCVGGDCWNQLVW